MADEKKYIDAMPLIAEYDKSIQWLKDNVEKMSWYQFSDQMASMQSARKMLLDAPAADVRPVVRGRWIDDGHGYQTCSNCGAEHHWLDYRADFCEDCGADMSEV